MAPHNTSLCTITCANPFRLYYEEMVCGCRVESLSQHQVRSPWCLMRANPDAVAFSQLQVVIVYTTYLKESGK